MLEGRLFDILTFANQEVQHIQEMKSIMFGAIVGVTRMQDEMQQGLTRS